MRCENCNEEHDGKYSSGRFCSSKCARSFSAKAGHENHKKLNCTDCGCELVVNVHTYRIRCDECKKQHHRKIRVLGYKLIHPNGSKKELVKLNCKLCDKEILVNKFGYCGSCHNEGMYNDFIEKWLSDVKLGGSCVSNYIRRYLFKKYDSKCVKCGWGEINPTTDRVPLEINHLDGNCLNNTEANLELICPNCHSLTDTYRSLNKNSVRNRKSSVRHVN